MISPYGVKVNMVCASCEYCKMQRVPAPTYWRNKCLKIINGLPIQVLFVILIKWESSL